MLQPRKPLNLTSAKEILETERKPLDLSSANAILKKKDSSESVEPQEPQTPTTELPSADGSLATQQPRKKFSLTQEDLKDIGKKQPTDMSGKPLLPNLKESQKVLSKIYKENQALEAEKKKFGDVFDKQLNIKPKVEESQYLEDRLSTIDTELINKTESFVVPELQYQFGDLGFKFEEARAGRDYVKATAPNGKTIEISLDNWQDKTSKSESEVLQKFIKENTPAKGLFVLEKTMREQDKKFNSEKQVDESVKAISNEVTALNAKQKQFLIKKSQFEKQLSDLGPSSELEQQRLALNEEMKSILEEEETIKQKSKRLDAAVGKYSIAKSKQGTWLGSIWNAINEGESSISAGESSFITDVATELAPTGFGMSPKDLKDVSIDIAKKIGVKGPSEEQTVDQWKKTLTENQLDKWEDEVDDYIKKDIKSRTLPYIRIGNREIFGDAATTKQFSDLKEKGFWGGAILGVAKSLPAMIGGAGPAGWAQRTAQMYAQISDGLAVEMENNPQFADITENEKLAITLPIGITSAVLEAYGLRNVMASKGVINSITMSALGRAGVGASAKTFRELVENEVESKLARGLITITAAGVAEFETGAAQELTETGFKVIYDKLKEKDMFNTPDSTVDLIENVLVAGAQEAVGGFVLGVPTGVSAAYSKKGFLKMDDATFETFANMANDEKMQSAYIASLKEKITQGIITEKEAKEELNNYRNSAGLYRQLPDGLTTEQQKEAMNLLKEKRDLENFVEGKDPALVVKAKNRITEINDSLTKLSETDAVQEQTTDESVLRTEQPEVGLQEMGQGDAQGEVATEQVTQEEVVGIPDEVSQPIELSVSETPVAAEVATEAKPEKEQWEIDYERRKAKLDEFNAENRPTAIEDESEDRNEFKISDRQNSEERSKLKQNVFDAQENISRVDDADAAIEEYNKKKKELQDFDNETQNMQNVRDVNDLIYNEIEYKEKDGDTYDFPEEFNKDPREAALKRAKEMIDFLEERNNENDLESIDRYKNNVKILEQDIKENPLKKNTIVTEQAPIEEKFIIDGKEYTKEEAIEKSQQNSRNVTYGSKMEYGGNNPQSKEFVDDYNRRSSPYFRDGRLKGDYIKQELLKAMDNMSFRKFGNLYRKHIDSFFSRASNEKSVGGMVDKNFRFRDLATYIIGDSNPDTFEEKDFRAFAKEAGIDIPEFQTTETKAEIAPAETINLEQITKNSYVDRISRNIIEKVGNNWVVKTEVEGKELFKSKTLKGAKEFVSNDNKEALRVQPTETTTEVAPEVKAEVTPTETTAEVAPVEELNNLLNVDTKEEGGLKKVYDFLDSLDNALDLDPNELNDVTRVMAIATAKAVVKTLKALVKAGMTLQEAIKQVASEQNLKVRDVVKGINALSEITKIAPGYNALMEKADALIARQKAKGIAEKKILSNLDTMIRKSPIYTDPKTTDAQRKIMEREARAKMGVSPKKSVSIGRVIGALNDIRNVSRAEKLKIISRIRELSKDAAKDLVEEIRELAKKGNITTTQAVNIISRFGKVNMLNEASVSNFVDYMTKVFADAEYDNKIKVAKGKLKNARKNINTKIGIADGLVGPLQRLFAINPELIPESYLERYLELVDMFGARQAVLTLEEKSKVTKDVIDILEEINNERSAVEELSERFNYSDNQVIEDGKLNYAATVKNMLKEGEITEEEAALMTKYKSEIAPKVEKSTLSEDELQQEKDDLVEEVKKSTINADDLPTRTERDAAKKLASLIKSPAIKELSNTQLKNLLKVIDNINNGYFAHSAQLIIEEINSINNSKSLESSVKRAKLLPLSKIYAQAKSIVTRKDAVLEMIRRNPLFNIDQVLGDFKTKDVFNSLLESAAEAEAKFTSELKAIQLKLTNAEEKIAKSFKLDANKTLMSKFKMMTYMVQLEYNSNPDSKQVNPASKFIEATINHINEGKSQFGEKDVEMLQEILDNYTDTDGNIDVKELYNSFNSAEKAGIKTIQEVNQSLKEKAEYTASVIRGQRINPLSNYIHLNVLSDTKPNDLASGESFADQYNNSLKPSTKAKSLIERTGKVSPLNFDVFASAQRGAKFVLMDFHLTEPIRTARKTINKTIASLGKIDKEKKRIINAINNSFEESVENLVNNSYIETSIGDDVANYIKKQGYRSVLAGTGRFAAEFLSNVGFVIISDPTTFAEGLKHTSILMSPEAPSIMHNVNSKEINRIFPSDTLSGRLIDTNILNEANGIKGGKAKNKIINKAQQIWNLTGKKYKNAVELTSDVLITTPDKAIMRPIWFGSFAANFKNETGQDVDFKKIAANDEVYMSKNKEAIDKAKDAADERSVITGASNNAFTGVLKGTSKPNQSNFIKGFNNFNSFMTRFLIYEYTSARTGIMAAMGNGSLSKRQGIALLGAVTTRMTVYSLLSKALGSGLIGLLFGDDDDDEEKSLDKSVGQALTSTFTSLLFNRDFGNASKAVINEGIERINENYLQALREGDYDPYKDAIQYTAIPIEKKGKQTGLYDYVESISGAYGPAIKTTNLILKTYSGEDKKEADAIQRQEDVKNIRIPLEVLGNAGFIPLYKDIRKEVMKEIYKGLDKENNTRVMTREEYDRLTK